MEPDALVYGPAVRTQPDIPLFSTNPSAESKRNEKSHELPNTAATRMEATREDSTTLEKADVLLPSLPIGTDRTQRNERREPRNESQATAPVPVQATGVPVQAVSELPNPELTHEDWEDHFQHTAMIEKAEREREDRRRQRRYARKQEKAQRQKEHADSLARLTVFSEKVEDSLADISKHAHASQSPHIYLKGAKHMDLSDIEEWYKFCRRTPEARMLHSEDMEGPGECGNFSVFVFNREGCVLQFSEMWMRHIIKERRLHVLYALAALDSSRITTDMDSIADDHAVFVYDPKDDASCDMMLRWKCDDKHSVCPILSSGQTQSCVIERKNQTFTRYNIA